MSVRPSRVSIETPGESIPGLLWLVPPFPSPAALLLHGLSSTKERMMDSIGAALSRRGISSLAIDLPLHGGREGSLNSLSIARPLSILSHWRLALTDAAAAVEFLRDHQDVDPGRVALIGYSLGAFLGAHVAADDPDLGHVVLANGGDFPDDLPFAPMIRTLADPTRAVRAIRRPLLMINGRFDRTVTTAQAKRLHAAAGDHAEVRWYPGGHWPPTAELDEAAAWVETHATRVHR